MLSGGVALYLTWCQVYMEFLHKFACFDCRVAFKRRATEKSDTGSAWQADSELAHRCPNCGHRMAFLGRNFRAPKQSDKQKWHAAKLLWEAGFRYCGSGSHKDPVLPESKVEAIEFVKANLKHSQKIAETNSWEKYT
ncbi:hypothetical protein VIBNISFn27_110005 [Vibrio nigripulchritudo SFn27]|nr:hypothetical protein VIBNIBLFn1_200005 [Vibrio nigripulchritudo BLFn1]CCN86568.1 hypothetical protein VIBNISFn27_110005 [Vibrio nigripulchritudo SFn27]CCN97185.1 hypothetical protein VIBNIENn2_890102 [Vibrio nigripulchritudo ENn2]CCO42982.1 hypothetical protein VIBNISFn135_910007 [Vibrio nigripulchritudo SFn135]CCO50618.1 hypothetical protein VIBNIWn13_1020007 [Vibrio nigripulchritudo Wn13]